MKKIIFLWGILFAVTLLADTATPPQLLPKRIEQSPKIDANLNDPIWQEATTIADNFTTFEPVFGKTPAQKTEVKVLYDNQAIYIGAMLYDTEANKIAHPLCSRDALLSANCDLFVVGFDTYHDKQNAFRFEVSAAGVQGDARLSPNNSDWNWDAVWESKVAITDNGWIVELKIPYSALRFPKKNLQTWGMNFVRYIQRHNETSTWSPINPNINGNVNQWGYLTDLTNIEPPLRLVLMPYLATYYYSIPETDGSNTTYNNSYSASGGLDLKYGINESFTVDMSLIPDFGQVQSDNTVINLGPFEVRYNERRPFFTEGTELFNNGNMFYSRRIGGQPINYYNVYDQLSEGEIVEQNPRQTQLLNATKFSGTTKKNLGIGVLNAVGAPIFATIRNETTNETRRIETAPLTNYNVLVLRQNLPHNSYIGFYNTNVWRSGSLYDANVSMLETRLVGKKNTYAFNTSAKVSQQYDTDKSIFGYNTYVGYSKISGKWRFDLGNEMVDNKYNHNDLGLFTGNNFISNFVGVKYMDFKAQKHLNSWNASLGLNYDFRFQPFDYQRFQLNPSINFNFSNFWSLSIYSNVTPFKNNDFYEPRTPNRNFIRPRFYYAGFWVGTDYRKKIATTFWSGLADSANPNDMYYESGMETTWRVNERLNIIGSVNATKDFSNYGYVNTTDNGTIIMGRRTINTVDNWATLQYTFTPRMNINFRARHYWGKVSYYDFHALQENGTVVLDNGYTQNHDSDFNAFNIDLVYSWEFSLGSRLNIIWKDAISQFDELGDGSYFDNIDRTFNTPASNTITVKLLYYLDYQRMQNWYSKMSNRSS